MHGLIFLPWIRMYYLCTLWKLKQCLSRKYSLLYVMILASISFTWVLLVFIMTPIWSKIQICYSWNHASSVNYEWTWLDKNFTYLITNIFYHFQNISLDKPYKMKILFLLLETVLKSSTDTVSSCFIMAPSILSAVPRLWPQCWLLIFGNRK